MFNALTGYLMGGIGLVAVALGGMYLWERGSRQEAEANLIAAKASLAVAVEANEQNVRAIEAIEQANKQSEQAALNLQAATAKVEDSGRQMDAAIVALERSNADVRSFLATRLPADLRSLLSRRSAAGGRVHPDGQDPAAGNSGGPLR